MIRLFCCCCRSCEIPVSPEIVNNSAIKTEKVANVTFHYPVLDNPKHRTLNSAHFTQEEREFADRLVNPNAPKKLVRYHVKGKPQ